MEYSHCKLCPPSPEKKCSPQKRKRILGGGGGGGGREGRRERVGADCQRNKENKEKERQKILAI